MLVVLVLLSVMLLGGMAFARLTEVGTLASGNTAYREASIQASEIGLNTAFQRIREKIRRPDEIPAPPPDAKDEDTAQPGWYWPTIQATNAQGIPLVDFDAAPSIVEGNYTMHYVAERLCEGAVPVTEPLRQCLVKQIPQPNASRVAGKEELDPPTSKQFRVTIRVTGPKGTQTWVQSLVTKG